MSCGCRNANQKSCQRYYNNIAQPLAATTTVQLIVAGARVVDTGVSIETQPQSYTIVKPGLYHIAADVDVNLTTAGDIVLQGYMNGVPLPCTTRNVTGTDGHNLVHSETDLAIGGCCDISKAITWTIQSVGVAVGTIDGNCTGIVKYA